MSWKKVSESRWERPVDGLEGYFVVMANISAGLCDGREHYTLFSSIRLETSLSDMELALQKAWIQLRSEQPQIAATIEGMNKVYEVPDEKALQEWLSSTFIVSDATNAGELYQEVKPIKQATVYYLPKSSEVAFRGQHYTLDGNGVMLFWHSFLDCLASPAAKEVVFGEETARLAPAMEDILGFSRVPSPVMSENVSALFMSWAGSIPGIGPVSKLGDAPSGRCQNLEMVFPANTSESLVTACKSKGITVTAAVHAAYIATLTRYANPDSKLSEYVTANQFNLRSYLPEPYNTSKYAISVYYTPMPYKTDLPKSYWELVESLNEYYATTIKDDPNALEMKGHFARVLCGAVQSPEFLANPIPKDALVSSLGISERYMQREYGSNLKVVDFKMGVDVVMGMSFLFIYSFRDQLRLVYSFNDGFEESKNIRAYMDEVQRILVEELLA